MVVTFWSGGGPNYGVKCGVLLHAPRSTVRTLPSPEGQNSEREIMLLLSLFHPHIYIYDSTFRFSKENRAQRTIIINLIRGSFLIRTLIRRDFEIKADLSPPQQPLVHLDNTTIVLTRACKSIPHRHYYYHHHHRRDSKNLLPYLQKGQSSQLINVLLNSINSDDLLNILN